MKLMKFPRHPPHPTHETLPAPQHTRKGREKARRRSRPPGGGRENKEGPRTGRGEKEKATKESRRGQEEERDPNSAREQGEEGGVEERAGLRCGEANPNQGLSGRSLRSRTRCR